MSDYFERIERHLLDAVERQAAPVRRPRRPARAAGTRPARARLAVATAAGTVALLALAAVLVAGLLRGGDGRAPDRAALGRQTTLDGALAVLRRDQRPGDAPSKVVAAARAAARRATGAFHGAVRRADVRLVARIEPDGYRLYLAPLRQPGAPAAAAATAALVVLAERDGRPAQYPFGLTAADLRDGRAWYLAWGLRAAPGRASDVTGMRSLQVQLVRDGAATVEYRYSATPIGRLRDVPRTLEVPVDGNAAVAVLDDGLADRYPSHAVVRDRDGRVLDRIRPAIPASRGPVAPASVCSGTRLPSRPTGRPVIPMAGATVGDVCRTAGPPARAYRRDDDHLLLLYPDRTVLGTVGERIGGVSHLTPGGVFPPPADDVLAPQVKLDRYPPSATARDSDRRSP